MPEPQPMTRPNQALQFLMPLSAARAATEEEGGGSWIHIMPIGRWKAPRQFYGLEMYEISAANIQEIVANFEAGLPGTDIPVDENHLRGPAPGWIKDLRAEADGLWARVEWTELGADYIAKELFRYVSPEWCDAALYPYEDPKTGEKKPWVLEGLALTNRPFFTELPAVASRQEDGFLVCTAASAGASGPEPDNRPDGAGRPQTQTGDRPMAATKNKPDPPVEGNQDPPETGDSAAALRAERDNLAAEKARLEAEAAERERKDQLEKLTARFAAVKSSTGQLAQAHAKRLAEAAMDIPDDKREAHVAATIEAMEKGMVPAGEIGGTSPHVGGGDINPALVAAAERLRIAPEFVYMAAIRGQGGVVSREAARQAVTAMGALTASVEIPSLSYEETMTLTRGMFIAGYESAAALVDRFANRVGPMNERTVDYRALGAPPRMREWLDEIQGAVLNTRSSFPVTVRDWEATVEIPLTEFKADRLGQYAMRIQQMGAYAKQHPDELLAALVVAAESTLCYDGQNLCDTDHEEGDSGSQSNLLTTGGDDNDIADIGTDLGTAIAAFQRFKDDKGAYLRIGSAPDAVYDVLCRPEVLPIFNQLATATQISGTSNQWKGRIRPAAIPELTTANEWFALWTGGPAKPFIAQFQEEPSALKELGPNSEHCKKTGKVWTSTQGHYTVAPGAWQYIIKIQKS